VILAGTSVKFIFRKKLPEENFYTAEFKKNTTKLVNVVLKSENGVCDSVNVLFCGDEEITEYNRKYLGHDYETDIITFRYDDVKVESDMIISLDTVKRNAGTYGTGFEKEIFRVIIHGVLHICGYEDKSRSGKLKMRKKENKYLKLTDVL
jgi:rRNA maturation RNase YbeY